MSYSSGAYVVGHSGFNFGDAVVLKVDRRGDLLWRRQFGAPNGVRDQATDVATDAQDNAYVLGQTYGNLAQPVRGGTDLFLRKYSASGQDRWTRQFGLEIDDYPWDIEVAGNSVYVLGLNNEIGAALYRFNKKTGGTWWKKSFSDRIENFAVDGSDNLYVAGETTAACEVEEGLCAYAVVKKLNAFGKVVWAKRLKFGEADSSARNYRFRDITLSGGDLYLTGEGFDTPNGEIVTYLVKLATTGATKWERHIGYSEDAGYTFTAEFGLSADRDGVYVTAVTTDVRTNRPHYSYSKYGRDGLPLWKVGGDGYETEPLITGSLSAVAAGSDNKLYLTGWVYKSATCLCPVAFLKRLDPVTGAVIWSR